MGFMGIGSGTKVKNKTSNAEKLSRSLALYKATQPWMTDSSQQAKGMLSEAMGRFYEPAPMDPRIASILGSLSPRGASMGQMSQGLMESLASAPTSSSIGMRPYGQPQQPWMRVNPRGLGRGALTATDWLGTQPSQAFQDANAQISGRLSRDMLNALLQPDTPGEIDQDAIRRALKTPFGKDLWGPPVTDSKGWVG